MGDVERGRNCFRKGDCVVEGLGEGGSRRERCRGSVYERKCMSTLEEGRFGLGVFRAGG